MSITIPLLHWGPLFLLKKISSLPPLALGFVFLLKKKFLGFKSTHEFLKYVQVEIMYKITIEPPLVVLVVAPTRFTKINES